MRYVLLIYGDEAAAATATATAEAQQAELAAWGAYDASICGSGAFLGGEALLPTATATSVRGDGDQILVSDGPFAETKEQLGGFYLIEAADLDEATAWAGRMPHIPEGGTVEIRPVMVFDGA